MNIIDLHSHAWPFPEAFSDDFIEQASRAKAGAVVDRKLLFGSDYPFTTVDASVAGLRTLNAMLDGTALPRLDEAQIEAMIDRDSLALLGVG